MADPTINTQLNTTYTYLGALDDNIKAIKATIDDINAELPESEE